MSSGGQSWGRGDDTITGHGAREKHRMLLSRLLHHSVPIYPAYKTRLVKCHVYSALSHTSTRSNQEELALKLVEPEPQEICRVK